MRRHCPGGPGGPRLHQRLFLWSGLSIWLTLLAFGAVHHGGSAPLPLALGAAGLVLWGASGALARLMVRPLGAVADAARAIGDGNLATRVELRHAPGEVGELADAVNDMAARIEKQLDDQRRLLAAVSHELRTPLGHMRVLTELARDGDTARLAELEREIAEIDALVDQLLAGSRLEFGAIDRMDLDAVELCARALERAGLDASLLEVAPACDAAPPDADADADEPASPTLLRGDPMLLSRALANLLDNAARHGGGVTALRLVPTADNITFEVADRGPGFSDDDLPRVFDSFYRGTRKAAGSLGLGLHLVQRIARAHGGRAWADNTAPGATVAFSIPRDGEA